MKRLIALASLLVSVAGMGRAQQKNGPPSVRAPRVQHVLVLTVEGMMALDLARYVHAHPQSALAELSTRGVTYTAASATIPDTAPSFLSMFSGGSPNATGVYFSAAYDRKLSPPGSDCRKRGARVLYDERSAKGPYDPNKPSVIDPTVMPLDPENGCTPLFPRSWLRVNTVYDVIKEAGGVTAWIDRHPTIADFLSGRSGKSLDDYLMREAHAPDATQSVAEAEQYDDWKLEALLYQIKGLDHTGARRIGVPAVFGMSIIAVGTAQKKAGMGYADASGTPSDGLAHALDHLDASVATIVNTIKGQKLYDSTLVVITAKHGQAPIDQTKRRVIDEDLIPNLIEGIKPGLVGSVEQEDVAFVWLTDSTRADEVVVALRAHQKELGIMKVYAGESLKLRFNDPTTDSRSPDIVVQPELGVIYDKTSATKLGEHGGFLDEDLNVALMLSYPGAEPQTIRTPVQMTQLAPTVLRFLGLDPMKLEAVRMEHTPPLPGLGFEHP